MDWLWCITKCRQNCVFRSCGGWTPPHRSFALLPVPRGQFKSIQITPARFSPQFIMVANCFGLLCVPVILFVQNIVLSRPDYPQLRLPPLLQSSDSIKPVILLLRIICVTVRAASSHFRGRYIALKRSALSRPPILLTIPVGMSRRVIPSWALLS
jgi:hypothetical protein